MFLGRMRIKKQVANIVTSLRIICSVLILLCPAFSVCFYILYLLCGFTDMVDGAIARKNNAVSEFGARLDTIADIVFITVALVKLLPLVSIPNWLWMWIAVISIIKIGNVVCGFFYSKRLISLHTVLNRITGLLLFLLPLTLSLIDWKLGLMIVSPIATLAAIQESYYIVVEHKYI